MQTRRIGFESLEQRRLLSTVGLNSIANVTLPAGTSTMVALNGSDPSSKAVNFTATTSDPSELTPLVMPQSNPSVQFTIAGLGKMTFQLLDNLTPNTVSHIEALVNAGFYNGDYIYRAETGSFALIQGGNNPPQINSGANVHTVPSGVTNPIDEEFNPDLNYTTAGVLAMARTSTENTSGTEFFVTDGATRSLDYAYTYFGFMTVNQAITYKGQSTTVLQALDSMLTTPNNGIDYLNTPVMITRASIINDTQNGVLMLRAPTSAAGNSYTVTVTASDNGTNTPTTRTFTVHVVTDTALSASTPPTTNPWALQTPKPPTAIQFLPQTGQGTTTVTLANNSSSNKMEFLVSGVTAGNLVTVFADGVPIGSATVAAGDTTVTVTSNGTTTLLDGMHIFTAAQTVQNVSEPDSGDSSQSEEANVDSLSSVGIQLQVRTALTVSAPIPTSSAGGNVTVSFSGGNVQVYDNTAHAVISNTAFTPANVIEVECPPGQTNNVSIVLPTSANAGLPQEVLVHETPGASGSTNNQVTVVGTNGANTFTVAGTGGSSASGADELVAANGLETIAAAQKLTLDGGAGNDDYKLNSSAMPTSIVDTGGYNTLDFSNDAAGVAVNLGLDKGQAQSIGPWNTTLAISGVISKLIGTASYNDVLSGGPAATTEIVAGSGNDTITGGSGNNILIGGGGSDTITGGQGKNLIIAGSGNNCNLYAEGSENIIFTGTTNVDANDQALLNLLDDGLRVSYGYGLRRLLASAANNPALLSPPVTFQDTGAHDTIFGSSANNWFVLGKNSTVKA